MIEFHYSTTANNFKIGIMLEETGIPYRLVKHEILEGTHLTPEFRRINPNSKVPAIVDHDPVDGNGPLAVFESGAILWYLAEKSGMLIPRDFRRRVLTQQWLIWQVSGMAPYHGQAHHFHRFAPKDQTYGVERYGKEARRLLQVLDNRLAEVEFVAEEYGIADITCYPQTCRVNLIGVDLREYPAIHRWAEGMKARPAVRRAAAAVMNESGDYYVQPRANLTDEQWSTLFGDRYHSAATSR